MRLNEWDDFPAAPESQTATLPAPTAAQPAAVASQWDDFPAAPDTTDWNQRAAEVYGPMHPELALPAEAPMPVRTSNAAPRPSLMQPGAMVPDVLPPPAPPPSADTMTDFEHLRSPELLRLYQTRNPEDFAKARTLLDQADAFGDTLYEQDQATSLRREAQRTLDTIIPHGDVGLRYVNDQLYRLRPKDEGNILAAQEADNTKRSIADKGFGETGFFMKGIQSAAGPAARGLENVGLVEPGTAAGGVHLNEAREALDQERNGKGWMRKALRGAGESLVQTALAAPGGVPGIVAAFAAGSYNDAKVEALDAGRSEADAVSYATKQAAIEGGITTAMQLVGAGGLESLAGGGVKNLARQTVRQLGGKLLAEQVEELSIATAQNMVRQAEKINPQNFTDVWKDTALQTAVTMGLASTPSGVMSATSAWAKRNPEAAAKVAALNGEKVSRSDLQKAGIDTLTNPSTAEERAEIVAKVKEVVAQPEYSDPQMSETYPPNVLGMENGEPVFGARAEKKPRGEQPAPEPTRRVPEEKPFALPRKVTKYDRAEPGDMVAYDGRKFIVRGVSENGNKYDLADENGATVENIDRRDLDGFQKVPKPRTPHPDVGPTDVGFTPPQGPTDATQAAPAAEAQVSPPQQKPIAGPPPVKPGFVRMYHGGDPDHDGKRWLSPSQDYAQGYADKNPTYNKVFYIDLPESDPRLMKSFDDEGTGQKAPYIAFEADEKTSRRMKLLETAPTKPQQVATPQPAAVNPTTDTPPPTTANRRQPLSPAETIREPNPAKRAPIRVQVAKAFPGQKVVDVEDGTYRVELQNGEFITVRQVDDLGPIDRTAAERSAGRKLSDEEFSRFKGRGSWRVSTPDGYETDGAGLMKIVDGDQNDQTVRHEALHVARSLGVLTDAEWKALVDKHAPDAKTDGDAEESIARALEAWKGPVGLWTKIKIAINRMLSALGVTRPTADTAATRLASGAVWSRPAKTESRKDAAARLSGDVRYSGSVSEEKNPAKRAAFKRWFGDSKIVNKDGTPKRMYHGTVSDFTEFDKDFMDPSALYGPGIYTTESPAVAGGDDSTDGYTSKGLYNSDDLADEHFAKEGESWESLEKRAREETAENYPGDDTSEWHFVRRTSDGDKMIAVYIDSNGSPNVMPLYVAIKNPLDIDADIDNWSELLGKLNEKHQDVDFDYSIEKLSELENEENIDGRRFYEALRKSADEDGRRIGKARANEMLKELGYDGIVHTGGLSGRYGTGTPHKVAIAFDPKQVKSATGNRGTFDPDNADIRYKGDVTNKNDPVANYGETDSQRKTVETLDKKSPTREYEDEAEVARKAKAELPNIGKKILDYGDRQVGFTEAAEVDAAKEFLRKTLDAANASNDPAKMAEAARYHDAYRRTGTAASQAFAARQDPVGTTPTQKRKSILLDALFKPPKKLQDKIDARRENGDKAGADELVRKWGERVGELKDRLKRRGINADDVGAVAKDRVKAAEMLREISAMKADGWDAAYEFWQNAILSGTLTHVANVAGNTTNIGVVRPAAKFIERTIGSLRNDPKAASLGEYRHVLQGIMPGISEGLRNAATAWKLEHSPSIATDKLSENTTRAAIGGKTGRIVRMPWRALLATDEFARAIVANMEVVAQAYRIAKSEGLTGAELDDRISELSADRTSAAWEAAFNEAEHATFTEKGGKGRAALKAAAIAAKKVPGVRYVVPFVNTPVNIVAQGLAATPLGIPAIMLKMYHNKVVAGKPLLSGLSKQAAMQVLGFGLLAALFNDDEEDPAIAGKAGKEPYTIRIGGKRYNYQRLEPLATMLGVLADLRDAYRSGDKATMLAAPVASLIEQVGSKTFFDGIQDIVKVTSASAKDAYQSSQEGRIVTENTTTAASEWASGFAASWVPNILKTPVRASRDEEVNRSQWGGSTDRDQWWDRLGKRTLQRTEIFSPGEVAKFDLWGNKKKNAPFDHAATNFMYRLLSPVKVTANKPHPGDELMANWNAKAADDDQAKVPALDPYYIDKGKNKSMTDEQFARYAELSGKIAARLYEVGNYDPENPTKEMVESLERNFGAARDKAKELLKDELAGKGKADTSPEALADLLRIERMRTIRETLDGGYTPKKSAKESVETFRERVGKEKERRTAMRQELLRLAGRKPT